MKCPAHLSGASPLSLGVGLLVGCFLVSLAFITANKSDILAPPILSPGSSSAENISSQEFGTRSLPSYGKLKQEEEEEISTACDPKSNECEVDEGITEALTNAVPSIDVAREQRITPTTSNPKKSDVGARPRPLCDLSNYRSDVCDLEGDVRIIGKDASSVMLVSLPEIHRHESWRIRPYARKSDPTAMSGVREVEVTSWNQQDSATAAPPCTVAHAVPAVVFSTAGYLGNYFHDFTDVLVPLFQTARQFDGEVQFLVSTYKPWWIGKYAPYFKKLSRYDIIDYDNDAGVHCFGRAIVGLRSDADLTIDPSKSAMGYSMGDFMSYMRGAYALPRDHTAPSSAGTTTVRGGKPRLLIISRKRTRRFTNVEKIADLAKRVGFEAVVAEAAFGNVSDFALLVNSCDALMGVHGAGLTNLVFLPANAAVIQVVPFGKLDWLARTYFGSPAKKMRLQYLEYSIGEEESTLREVYGRDDPVLKDPAAIHKLGWFKMGEIYLDKQDVRLNLKRFKPVLVKALKLLRK